jgi:two-component system chemotaxis response regulator CheY
MPLKVLIINESRIMRNLLIRTLNRSRIAEFEFVEAADGARALVAFDDEPIDIVITDWQMPDMTSMEFVRKVRARGDTGHTRLVVLTDENLVDGIEEVLGSAGADAFLCKPFTVEEVEQKLRDLVEGVIALKGRPRQIGNRGWLSRMFS